MNSAFNVESQQSLRHELLDPTLYFRKDKRNHIERNPVSCASPSTEAMITIYRAKKLPSRLLLLHEFQCLLSGDHINRTSLLSEADSVALLRDVQHLRAEGSADELSVGGIRDRLEHLGDSGSVLGVQVGVDLVEEVEWCGITSLDGEHEGEGAKTCRIVRYESRLG